MINISLIAASAGVVASGVLILFSAIIPRWFVSAAVHQLDVIHMSGRILSKKESYVVGILIHLIFSLFFGALFGVGMRLGIVDISIVSMMVFYVVVSLVLGGIVLPIEGHGLFGWKEDHWIPVDLLAMNAVWVLIFWALLAVLI